MLIIPAIDLYNNHCVRLEKGNFARVTEYSNDPVRTALQMHSAGAQWIHIVDLDAAQGKGKDNRSIIGKIRDAVPSRIEAGGGIRNDKDVKELFSIGIDRLIVGTVAAKSPETVTDWIQRYGNIFIAGIDAENGMVRVSGWQKESGLTDTELAVRLKNAGVRGIIYTDISRDGMLKGPGIERTGTIADASGLPVVLSGGISSEEDVDRVFAGRKSGIAGIITGKALYEKRINLNKMIRQYQDKDPAEGKW